MSALEHAPQTKAISRRVTAIALRVAGFVRGLVRAWVNRRQAAELAELSDHQLADIGLTRTDLAAARRLPFGQDPTMSLAEIVRRRGFDHDFVRLNT